MTSSEIESTKFESIFKIQGTGRLAYLHTWSYLRGPLGFNFRWQGNGQYQQQDQDE